MATDRKQPPYFIRLLNAMDGSDLTLNERAVLMAQFQFGTHANGRDSYVSEARLLECMPTTSAATLRRTRRALQDKGWLVLKSPGHGGSENPEKNKASRFDIHVPPPSAPAPKPKRAARNPEGKNGRSKKNLEVTRDLNLEVKQTSKPSNLEVTGDHLPRVPEIDAENSSVQPGLAAPSGAQQKSEKVCMGCGQPIEGDNCLQGEKDGVVVFLHSGGLCPSGEPTSDQRISDVADTCGL